MEKSEFYQVGNEDVVRPSENLKYVNAKIFSGEDLRKRIAYPIPEEEKSIVIGDGFPCQILFSEGGGWQKG